MKKTSLASKLALLALAAAGVTSTHATQVPQFNNGDLLMGFYDPNNSLCYVADLGPVSQTHASFTLFNSSTHLATDLASTFGNTWYSGGTDGSLYLGFAASTPLTGQIWVSNPNAGTPWEGSVNQSAGTQDIASIGSFYSNQVQAHNEQYSKGFVESAGAQDSWAALAGNGANLETFFGGGGDGGISDVVANSLEFDFVPSTNNAGTDLGEFTIDSTGDVSFLVAGAVPEPSTYAAIGLGALLLVAFRRRRQTA